MFTGLLWKRRNLVCCNLPKHFVHFLIFYGKQSSFFRLKFTRQTIYNYLYVIRLIPHGQLCFDDLFYRIHQRDNQDATLGKSLGSFNCFHSVVLLLLTNSLEEAVITSELMKDNSHLLNKQSRLSRYQLVLFMNHFNKIWTTGCKSISYAQCLPIFEFVIVLLKGNWIFCVKILVQGSGKYN